MNACVADLGCGSAASQGCYSVSPSTSILCSNSTYSEFTTNDTTYSWKCSKDGTSVDCSVNRCAVC